MQVVVCDDEDAPRDGWVADIKAADQHFEILQLGRGESEQLQNLLNRRFALRADEAVDWTPTLIDNADILVVDYDLTLISKETRYTGEAVARLARMFSTCGYVIVMNQYPGVGYDLTLRGHLVESYADLNIDAEVLGAPALWSRKEPGQFAPWYWDHMVEVLASRRTLAAELQTDDGFDRIIFDYIAMPASARERLSDSAAGFIDAAGKQDAPFGTTTFRQFLGTLSEHKDATKLLTVAPECAARTAVARIGKWLSRSVLGGQDVLVDVPHLLARMPYLLHPDIPPPTTIDEWNDVLDLGAGAVNREVTEAALFTRSTDWIGKDTFWWSEIEDLAVVDYLRDIYDFDKFPDMVFAEDTSRFIEFDKATEFRAGFHNIYDRRYAERPDPSIRYAPRSALTFAHN